MHVRHQTDDRAHDIIHDEGQIALGKKEINGECARRLWNPNRENTVADQEL